jgi:tyrosine aminotransferase
VEVRFYDCLEENDWEADLNAMERLCDDGTRAILVVRYLAEFSFNADLRRPTPATLVAATTLQSTCERSSLSPIATRSQSSLTRSTGGWSAHFFVDGPY